jgi:hypothetical protein
VLLDTVVEPAAVAAVAAGLGSAAALLILAAKTDEDAGAVTGIAASLAILQGLLLLPQELGMRLINTPSIESARGKTGTGSVSIKRIASGR